ncbi:anaphase-promoting complex, cyclosome, subunit 4-domain-containing protein [Mycena maculata]|uniref:Anaphase-promoting complex subunit 4 n=1 Tax=Mycena maculata TaxID=230809 RepID=A0AAD7KFX0_9AGAR|nr:anaphase-promoting complex, cyclosome, subunit 4-domain-containing protein [Mycena maculata]
MEQNFASLAAVHLPSVCKPLLPSSCCPDKDLLVLVSRLGGRDRMSLWKMQGSKTWEVDVGIDEKSSEQIVGLAWSPDGQSIAVAHDPPRVTLHSVQDGHEERTLSVSFPSDTTRITDLWWFRAEKTVNVKVIPDIFKRNGLIPGTSHSVLKTLPLLDSLQEESQKLTATDLFAFQGSQTRSQPKSSLPDVIKSWPTLNSDPIVASMGSHVKQLDPSNGHLDVADDANLDSILVVTDDAGRVHCFLDGSYHLGPIPLGPNLTIPSLFKHPKRPVFFLHPQETVDGGNITDLSPVYVRLPMLEDRQIRDMARVSSSSRELLWYCIRVVKEMRAIWFGSESLSGARELGPKWIRALEKKQREQFGQQEPTAMLDLTQLLLTGRASEVLTDFIGSSEQMSERGIQKWESSVTEALVKLHDCSEKRVTPACQRLHLILEEVLGWSQLPQYASFQLATNDLETCIDLTGRAIFIATWLAAVARRELSRFKEFITWLRAQTAAISSPTEFQSQLRHDILEVNNYLMSGLVVSSVDKWFMGPVPQFNARELGILDGNPDLRTSLEHARAAVGQTKWQLTTTQNELNHLDRNLDALVQELALRCQRAFDGAAGATSRAAVVSARAGSTAGQAIQVRPAPQSNPHITIRDRIILSDNEDEENVQYLAMHIPAAPLNRTFLCLARVRFGGKTSQLPPSVGIALLDGTLPAEQEVAGPVHLEILDAQFFDDASVVIVYRIRNQPGGAFIATVGYSDLEYQELGPAEYVRTPAREDLMQRAMELWEHGQLASIPMPIKGRRELSYGGSGPVSMALNVSPDIVSSVLIHRYLLVHLTAEARTTDRLSDIALRKKKNADAQAAFRARRANYIATLEETGNLESVVLQLQDSCREARSEAQELRQQNASLRHEYREREKCWRALWQSRKTGENDELPPLPQPILNGHVGSSQLHPHPYGAESMAYRSHDDPTMCSGQYNGGQSHSYNHSPSMSYTDENSPHSLTQRGAKYGPYSYVHGSNRDHSWQQNIPQNASSGGESGPPPSAHSTNSPSFSESPALTSSELSVPFPARFGEDQKVPVSNLDAAPYVFPGSRSMSPSSTTPSSSSASLTSPFQFTFPDGAVPHERSDFDYRRNSNPRPDIGLHGGNTEVSLSGPGSDAVRYRLGTRRTDSGADRPLPILPPLSISDNSSQHDRGSSDGDSNSYGHPRLRPRRESVVDPPSRSTSPSSVPPLSGTLAVIKAQAFGALRRTRARTKKTSDGPAKTALDVLEARGIEMGVSSSSKRQRTEESDDGEMQHS